MKTLNPTLFEKVQSPPIKGVTSTCKQNRPKQGERKRPSKQYI